MVDRRKWGPELASRRASKESSPRRALVVGCAESIWDDVQAAFNLCDYHAIYCVKLAGVYWPGKFECFVGLHPEYMDVYEKQRHDLGYPNGYEIVAPLPEEVGVHGKKGNITRRISYRWKGMTSSASSGIYGAKVALEDGCDRVVLAGIPMTPEAGHFMPTTKNVHNQVRGKVWAQHSAFVSGFNYAIPFLKGRVRSMSGETMKILGTPNAEWLNAS